MLSAFKIIIFAVTLLFPLQSVSAQGGQVILDIKESPAAEMIDYPGLYKEYLREIDAFDEKYPGSQIEEDFVDDILSLHPDYTDEQAATKAGLLRLGIRGRRTYRFWEAQVKEFLLKNDIPLYFADDQYEMGGPEEYQKSDRPLIIKDFKKVVAYSDSSKDRQAVAEKLARDAGRMTPYERSRILKKALLERDWKTLISYGLFDGTALEDERGIGSWVKTPELQARLLASVKTLPGDGKISGALQLYTMPGWFLLNREYQDNPALQVDFNPSENLRDIRLNWPLPRRYFINLEQSFTGYPGLTTIPFQLAAVDSAKDLKLKAGIRASLCNESGCRQVELQPELKLTPGQKTEASQMAVMLRLMNNYAPQTENSKLRLQRLIVEDGETPVLRLEAETAGTPTSFEAFIEGEGAEEFAPPLVRIDGSRVVIRFIPLKPDMPLLGRKFSIVAGTAPDVSVRREMTAQKASLTDTESGRLSFSLLMLAFLGGLLLNVMPCVFPVMALKIMAFTRFGAMDMRKIRLTFAGNLLGIAAAFAVLIAALIGLKLLGRSVGWGMQFQNIGFLTLMVFVISAFIAHLWGLIHLPGPEHWEKIINRRRGEFAIQFLSGAFLVLLSTSCSAPYLGTALGLALAGTPLQIAVVVGCVGLGLAAPYILFAVFPAAAYYMPRPGKWLHWVNALMFAMLFATLLWLLALLVAQGGSALWWQFALFISAFWLVLYLRRLALESLEEQENDSEIYGRVRRFFNMVAVLLLIALVFWGWRNAEAQAALQHRPSATIIDDEHIRQKLNRGQSVLVKVGANWCLSCKYNDFAAFEDPQVQQLLEQHNIAVIEVDWSDYNQEVLDFMQKFGRSGLPFYIIFTPQIPGGMVLPEILNEQDLRSLLEKLHRL